MGLGNYGEVLDTQPGSIIFTNGPRRKRDRNDEDDNDDEEKDKRDPKNPRRHGTPRRDCLRSLLACPYRKRNPQQYCISDWLTCANNGYNTIARLK